jgi:hypothetical protein
LNNYQLYTRTTCSVHVHVHDHVDHVDEGNFCLFAIICLCVWPVSVSMSMSMFTPVSVLVSLSKFMSVSLAGFIVHVDVRVRACHSSCPFPCSRCISENTLLLPCVDTLLAYSINCRYFLKDSITRFLNAGFFIKHLYLGL